MKLTFPKDFIFGTSTSAYQIETGSGHDWCGVKSRDGFIFECTTDHEKRFEEDAAIIAGLAPHYRMSLMWSKLQPAANSKLDPATVAEYHRLFRILKAKGVNIMLVLHHFANASWFAAAGGWEKEENIPLWIDYAQKVVDEYGQYVTLWNTFNEPNLYVSLGWCLSEFPPYKKNIIQAVKVIQNIGKAHEVMYDYIKEKYPDASVGISHNCTLFTAENYLGILPAQFLDWWFMEYLPGHFTKTDFFGMSYYAKISHDPFPITYLNTPFKVEKLGKPHDDMWEYYPQGILTCMQRYWEAYKKPIIITENGICTSDDNLRIQAIQDYMIYVHEAIQQGIDVRGYYHWSAWDNFEWSLGPTFQFGLYACDPDTKERFKKPSADLYAQLAHHKQLEIRKAKQTHSLQEAE